MHPRLLRLYLTLCKERLKTKSTPGKEDLLPCMTSACTPDVSCHLGIFQATPKGTILPLWEKCNICFVKLSYSTADNQGTAYLLNIPSQEQAAKDSAWAPLLDQPTNSPPGCCTASLHPSQPTSPVQHTVSKGLWFAARDCLSLSPAPLISLLHWSVTTILQRLRRAWQGLGHSSSVGREGLHLIQSLGRTSTDLCELMAKLAPSLFIPTSTGTKSSSSLEHCYPASSTAFSKTSKWNGAACVN